MGNCLSYHSCSIVKTITIIAITFIDTHYFEQWDLSGFHARSIKSVSTGKPMRMNIKSLVQMLKTKLRCSSLLRQVMPAILPSS